MKRLLFGTILLALVSVVPITTMAAVDINIGFSLPPPIVFQEPPDVIVMPETSGVYVAPDIDADMYFWNGFWWRLWEGRWYRSAYYDRDWAYYDNVPNFYYDIDPYWRDYYRNHNWYGHQWNHERIPYQRFQQNWRGWQTKRSWGGQKNWGVQGYQPRPQSHGQVLRQQRQQQYQQRPEVQKHQEYQQQQRQQQPRQQPQERFHQPPREEQRPQGQQQRQPQVQQPREQPRERVQQPQRQEQPQQQHSQPQGQQHQGGSQPPQSQGKPQEGDVEHRK